MGIMKYLHDDSQAFTFFFKGDIDFYDKDVKNLKDLGNLAEEVH